MSMQRLIGRIEESSKIDDDAMAEEILTVMVDGKSVEEHMIAYIKNLIADGQVLNRQVEKASQKVRNGYKTHGEISERAMLKAFSKVVKSRWGEDAMTNPLTRLVALGDYIF